MFISLYSTQIKKAISRDAIVRLQLGNNHAKEIRKYSPDQPRDYHGRFGSGSVIFEFAPNPDNKAVSDHWNSLSAQERAERSQKLADEFIPKIMADQGIKGGVVRSQIGSYENDTNTSFTLVMPEGSDPTAVVGATKALGYNLSQKAMMTVADVAFPGSEACDAINIESSKEFNLLSAKAVYDDLRTIKVGDKNAVDGQTTTGKTMSILNIGQTMGTDKLMQAIQEKLPEGYVIHKSIAHYWMPTEEKDYGENSDYRSYGRQGREQAGRMEKPVQQAPGDYRREIASIVSKFLNWIRKYSPDQLRDAHGQWTTGGAGSSGVAPPPVGQRNTNPNQIPFTKAYRKSFLAKLGAGPTINALHSNQPLGNRKKQPFSVRYALKNRITKSRFALSVKKIKAHPVQLAFANLHKKYEPLVQKAFLKVVDKIKAGINMPELVQAVDLRDVPKITEMLVGNKFKTGLEGEFKSLLFEVYHAGGVIGASQLKGQHVRKGGPGSGQYLHRSYNQILSSQYRSEGKTPAVVDHKTGKMPLANSGEVHEDVISRVLGTTDWKNQNVGSRFERGFVDEHMNFRSRDKEDGFLSHHPQEPFMLPPYAMEALSKGGPGSGPHATGADKDRFRRILAYQRALENNKPALRHDISGEVVPAEGDEMHLDILDRIGGDSRDWQEGFLTREGRFVSRDQAESQLGFRTLAYKAFSGSLDLQNPEAEGYLETELPTLIKQINEDQAKAVQAVLLQGIQGGHDGPWIARQLKQVVGLTDTQAQWVANFRTQLETGVNGSFMPVDERRLSAVDSALAQDQFEAPTKDPATVDLLVDKYAASLTAKRGLDIAISEIHSAEIQGQDEIWHQAADLGYLDTDITRRNWGGIHDGKEREDHLITEDMNPDGVGLDEPFQTPVGDVMNPGDSGDDGFDCNCRCYVYLTFNDPWGRGTQEGEDQDADTEEG